MVTLHLIYHLVFKAVMSWCYHGYIDGLMQERRNSIANPLELRLSCTSPSIWTFRLCFQLLLGVLQLGWITVYLSDPLTRGYMTASAIYVMTSQVKYLFGLRHVEEFSGPLKLFYVSSRLISSLKRNCCNFEEIVVLLRTWGRMQWRKCCQNYNIFAPNVVLLTIYSAIPSQWSILISSDQMTKIKLTK